MATNEKAERFSYTKASAITGKAETAAAMVREMAAAADMTQDAAREKLIAKGYAKARAETKWARENPGEKAKPRKAAKAKRPAKARKAKAPIAKPLDDSTVAV